MLHPALKSLDYGLCIKAANADMRANYPDSQEDGYLALGKDRAISGSTTVTKKCRIIHIRFELIVNDENNERIYNVSLR